MASPASTAQPAQRQSLLGKLLSLPGAILGLLLVSLLCSLLIDTPACCGSGQTKVGGTARPCCTPNSAGWANNLINEGDNKFEVIQKCGEPDKRETFDPLIGSDNKPANKSVSVENWMYGPSNGMYRCLKFIDGILLKIESRRQ